MDASRIEQVYSSECRPFPIREQQSCRRDGISDAFGGLSSVDMYPAPFVIQEHATVPVSSHNSSVKDNVFDGGRLFEGQLSFRNTFVHFPVDRPVSLEAFTNDRNARSCPSSGVGFLGDAMNADDVRSYSASGGALPTEPVQPPVVLSLVDSVPEPTFDVGNLSDLPSVGSAGHHMGTCNPCAFTIKGCASGAGCSYCHLCDPTEKKRRRKEKASIVRGLRTLKKMDPRWILSV